MRVNRFAPAAAALALSAVVAAACGSGSTSSPSPSATPSPAADASAQHFRDRTPNPAVQTAIAQGTRVPFFDRTPDPAEQTAIAQGTTFPFADRTPDPDVQTAIAQGTPASALRGGFGFRGLGGGQVLAAAATILGIDENQLRSELQTPGATLTSVAAAYGKDRRTFRQALIDAVTQRLNTAVQNGAMTQAQATEIVTAFQNGLDRLLDNPGAALTPEAEATPTP